MDLAPVAIDHQIEEIPTGAVFLGDFEHHVVGVRATWTTGLAIEHRLAGFLRNFSRDSIGFFDGRTPWRVIVKTQDIDKICGFLQVPSESISHGQGVLRVERTHMLQLLADKRCDSFFALGLFGCRCFFMIVVGVGFVHHVPHQQTRFVFHAFDNGFDVVIRPGSHGFIERLWVQVIAIPQDGHGRNPQGVAMADVFTKSMDIALAVALEVAYAQPNAGAIEVQALGVAQLFFQGFGICGHAVIHPTDVRVILQRLFRLDGACQKGREKKASQGDTYWATALP